MISTLSEDDRLLLQAALTMTWVNLLPKAPEVATAMFDLMMRVGRARTVVLNNEINRIEER